ncbi:hypothetical protein ACHAXA_007980 [Cyclostephanos tholiformis]|uniref:Uncharacterized protein n=1 Tax=Cyclostephanos tholiformis TaxID=382380 RepID=A0ABD3RC83_9STRA
MPLGNDDSDNDADVFDGSMETYPPGSVLDALSRWSSSTTTTTSSSSSSVVPSTHPPLSHQVRTVIRVGLPSVVIATIACAIYPTLVHWLLSLPAGILASGGGGSTATTAPSPDMMLYTDDVLTVLSNDLSQYVQNILTTCALLFGILVGQAYYFTYKEQERVYYALFVEVAEAKSLMEQISLLSYGRGGTLYPTLLSRMDDYVRNDLGMLSMRDPIDVVAYTGGGSGMHSSSSNDDPLESILYATSVGVPGPIYETVRSLRRARSERCGALQSKLPDVQMHVLRLLGVIVLSTFPICGSGSSAIAPNVLILQSYMFGILAFGLTTVLGVVEELRCSTRRPGGAYGVDGVLGVMVSGLVQELDERMVGEFLRGGIAPLVVAGPGPPPERGGGGGSVGEDDDECTVVVEGRDIGVARAVHLGVESTVRSQEHAEGEGRGA